MADLTLRNVKGSPLTNQEVDDNFSNLNTDKLENVSEDTTPQLGGDLDTNGNDIKFGDNDVATFGDSDDLQIFHNGAKSFIKDTGTGALVLDTDGDSVRISHSDNAEEMARFTKNGSVLLKYDGADKLATTSSGVDVTGTLVSDGLTVDGGGTIQSATGGVLALRTTDGFASSGDVFGALEFRSPDNSITEEVRAKIQTTSIGSVGNADLEFYTSSSNDVIKRMDIGFDGVVSLYEDTGTTAKLTWDASAEELQFKDNVKAEFGDGGDLQIYHDGDYSYVSDQGTGDLLLQGNNLRLVNYPWTKNYLTAVNGGAVNLYYDGVVKFATTSTGIDVTGTVTADGLTVDGSANAITLQSPSQNVRYKITDGTVEGRLGVDGGVDVYSGSVSAHPYRLRSNDTKRQEIASNGDISFYDNTGTSQDFYWDASTSRLGLGTTSPSQALDVSGNINQEVSGTSTIAFKINADLGTSENRYLRIQTPATDNTLDGFTFNTNNSYIFQTDSANNFEIDSSGDISFYNEAGTSKNFYWDASSSRLGLNNTSPSSRLHIDSGTSTELLRIDHEYAGNSPALILNNQSGNLLAGSRISFRIADTEECAISWAYGSGGASYLAFHANESERMRLDSIGRLGIGTTTPSTELTVSGTITETSDGTDYNIVSQYDIGTEPNEVPINAFLGSMAYQDAEGVNIDELVVNQNLGIGTTSPTVPLQVVTSSGNALRITRSGVDSQHIEINETDGSTHRIKANATVSKVFEIANSFGDIRFRTSSSIGGDTEAARIDSSGNLLVGTTDNIAHVGSSSGEGISLSAGSYGGFIGASRSDNVVTVLNRQTSDGTIAEFRKDGSTVGSIGAKSGDLYIGTGDVGLKFSDQYDTIHSVRGDTGADLNGAVDLGRSNVRWRNLYLSGGVYLGGTGSANLLNDYEEGTWTPVLTMTTSGDMTASVGGANYTKIGRMVHFTCYVYGIDTTSPTPSGEPRLTGLPFASKGSNTFTPINITYASFLANSYDKSYGGYVQSGESYIRFNEGNTSILSEADLESGTNRQIMISGVYQTA